MNPYDSANSSAHGKNSVSAAIGVTVAHSSEFVTIEPSTCMHPAIIINMIDCTIILGVCNPVRRDANLHGGEC
ncbi:hypothetical protein [Cycloclasticus sp.]|uniref:hypothetical protein n=1 Tax=Cycloclasticus sp. TaxID=2024830 RepID=UPI00257DF406|nr:hypothetical protein [Cycloclasticus sp.]